MRNNPNNRKFPLSMRLKSYKFMGAFADIGELDPASKW